jgi:type II secretory pathway pseudopilin PulG
VYKNVTTRQNLGFTITEVILAIGLAAVVLLALLAQNASLLGANQKQDNLMVASDVAASVLNTVSIQIKKDNPSGLRLQALDRNNAIDPLLAGSERVGHTDYDWTLAVSDVVDSTSNSPVGTGPTGSNGTIKLKRLDVSVTWWSQSNNERQGMGKLEVRGSKLLKVKDAP